MEMNYTISLGFFWVSKFACQAKRGKQHMPTSLRIAIVKYFTIINHIQLDRSQLWHNNILSKYTSLNVTRILTISF